MAIEREVSPATQNQALTALVYLFRDVFGCELDKFTDLRWAKKSHNLPVVFTREEAAAVLKKFKAGSQQKLIATYFTDADFALRRP